MLSAVTEEGARTVTGSVSAAPPVALGRPRVRPLSYSSGHPRQPLLQVASGGPEAGRLFRSPFTSAPSTTELFSVKTMAPTEKEVSLLRWAFSLSH